MSDHDGAEPVPETSSHHVSRRGVLRAGLVALTAAQLPDGLVSRALAQGAKPGANLIGKLEGAEVVTDPARYPKTFKEAPQLAELVKAGKLPPVQERIGQDPLVVKPLREIGKYGGTSRRGFPGPVGTPHSPPPPPNHKPPFFSQPRPPPPAHSPKHSHPKYPSKADLEKKLAGAKFENWALLQKGRTEPCRNPDLPVVTPWKTVSPINTPTWILERNPYSVWVDTDGNQLPYIDRIRMTLGENLELINLRAIAGEYDSQARHIDISKLPVLLENQQRGNYRVHLDPSDQGADVGLFCNQSYDKDAEIAKWLSTRNFRIALSHGIDRQQINEVFVLGLGQTGSAAPGERTPYFPGPEYKTLDAAHDVKKANEKLDAPRLTKRDAQGYRLRNDGGGRLPLALTTYLGFLAFKRIAEMIVEHWKKIGIRGEVQEMERGLATARLRANEHQVYFETQWGADNIYGHIPLIFPSQDQSPLGPLYGVWYSSAGAKGKQPPPPI